MAEAGFEADDTDHRPRPLWMAWRPRIPRWLPDEGPTAYDSAVGRTPAGNPAVVDYDTVALLVHVAVGAQWVIVILIAPAVALVRVLRNRA